MECLQASEQITLELRTDLTGGKEPQAQGEVCSFSREFQVGEHQSRIAVQPELAGGIHMQTTGAKGRIGQLRRPVPSAF
eukprot:6088946-Alexandrium_andersonii.AAC.1